MKKRKVFEAMQGIGLAGTLLGVCGYVSNLKKLGQADTEAEVEERVKGVKRYGTLTGVSGVVAGTGLMLDSYAVDKMSVEEMEEMESKIKAEIAKELEADEEEEETVVDDSDIDV